MILGWLGSRIWEVESLISSEAEQKLELADAVNSDVPDNKIGYGSQLRKGV